ncbi:cysteine synthase [Desulfovibrio inopinatus]|uniref:cysteine synthase n=1 Tax=Desulfovibrio inopinatus TaxID=102109 RepID=UPI000422A402|nr:cysteine synthase [Desulfovibrio inopinatus]
MLYKDVLSLVGNTPLVVLNRINPHKNVTIAAKVEMTNPGGSIKDRVGLSMIEAAEASGELTPEKTVIEATSGNTGIGLAMVCAMKGYKLQLLMSSAASEERKRIVRAYGADIVLTPGHLGTDGAIEEAYRLYREHPDKYVLMDQFNNPASIDAHYHGTGLEIWNDTDGKVTHVVATLGTSGTIMGITKRMREMNPAVKILAVEPRPGHKIQGLKNMQESYPPGIYNKKSLDSVLRVEDEVAFDMCKRLAREEGLFVGMSSGAALAGALMTAERLESGLIVVIFPDGGERYLSTPLFAAVKHQGVSLYNVAVSEKIHPVRGGGGTGLFTTGPALSGEDDIDAWRRIVFLDVLANHLAASGERVHVAVGLADMDDRTLDAARSRLLNRVDFTGQALAHLHEIAERLAVSENVEFVTAGKYSKNMLDMVEKLVARGSAYEKLRSVYFDVARDKAYGSLLQTDLGKLSLGKTVDLENYLKENPMDFTLLKRVSLQDLKQGEGLVTTWGNVRPSWFLQMCAAGLAGLPRLSVVMVGEAQTFPHLENLRAIWSLTTGAGPEAWMVARRVVSKLDKLVATTMTDLLAHELAISPFAIRLWLLSASYRKPLSLTLETLGMWTKNWRRIQDVAAALAFADTTNVDPKLATGQIADAAHQLSEQLSAAIEDDLSLFHFWPDLFEFCRIVNTALAENRLQPAEAAVCRQALLGIDAILHIIDHSAVPLPQSEWPQHATDLVVQREQARRAKDYATADNLRRELATLGYKVEDNQDGVRLYRVE